MRRPTFDQLRELLARGTPRPWQPSRFVDSPRYAKMPDVEKRAHDARERRTVREPGALGSPGCNAILTATTEADAELVAAAVNLVDRIIDDGFVDRLLLAVFQCHDGSEMWAHAKRDPDSFRDAVAFALTAEYPRGRRVTIDRPIGATERRALDTAMDNVLAWRLGEACIAAAKRPGGDLIDQGLALWHELDRRGFVVTTKGG